ncbi:beta-glucuronidase [Paenibacillus spiritus]|uniref:beta-galactosidase n=1 Tax=Paenibacillus spiritus TaxID=2496557 RepID=A0A5J5GBV0_9BACL|nr:glycoside hydrolase family 2 TIM barrel-domain containing protein [Paenibacillus spiritus]KAA9005373.1 beta-glucuronidase [Paenibacillus spiritus]
MLTVMNLEGEWKLQLDAEKQGLILPYTDSMNLPGTTSHARKGPRSEARRIDSLTDPYLFEGWAWFSREIDIPEELSGMTSFLFLERTRMTTVWLDEEEVGSRDSLNAPHLYDLTGRLEAGRHRLTIRVANTDYPTRGGHLTSPDTQTNWNGITGRIELQFCGTSYLSHVRLDPDVPGRSVRITAKLRGSSSATLTVSASGAGEDSARRVPAQNYAAEPGKVSVVYELGADALLWSDSEPGLYNLTLTLTDAEGKVADRHELLLGLREFKAEGDKFTINGEKTFLRGKHDGLIFPLTGYAPTDVEEWVRILRIAKSYGINHYRFHTCCPPEAAFTAADRLGIYMQPELPFWGTVTEEGEENHNQTEQDYLIREGYAILEAFGNHPSFVMMSLGNELWGSRPRIDAILEAYQAFDDRHLYTQGSNNHQWVPEVLEHDDFFSGVRFTRDRLIRGSYAMCDAPLGHVQTDVPGTMKDYDDAIVPPDFRREQEQGNGEDGQMAGTGTVQIQYGTEARTVRTGEVSGEWIPRVPVVSHEIGQYATYPDFAEIGKYTGVLKAENFKIFRERLENRGLGHLAEAYSASSGQLAAACYKEELEAAFRSRRLAGFQLLDLQDFSGQGTALVGVLDAFMESKGMVTPEEWRSFCGEAVLLARFPVYNWTAGENFRAHVELCDYRSRSRRDTVVRLEWELTAGGDKLAEGTAEAAATGNYTDLCDLEFPLPGVKAMTRAALSLRIPETDIAKTYDLWIYPEQERGVLDSLIWFRELSNAALALLEQGESVLLLPSPGELENAVQGMYSTDFWCYPMFRSISESMGKPEPVGTLGLLIENRHPVFRDFPTEAYSTYPLWTVVENSASLILDELETEWNPIVRTIDNFERNHHLGLLLECRVGEGRLLICPLNPEKAEESPEGRQFLASLARYVQSEAFRPTVRMDAEALRRLIR